jgi:hypothetical protein
MDTFSEFNVCQIIHRDAFRVHPFMIISLSKTAILSGCHGMSCLSMLFDQPAADITKQTPMIQSNEQDILCWDTGKCNLKVLTPRPQFTIFVCRQIDNAGVELLHIVGCLLFRYLYDVESDGGGAPCVNHKHLYLLSYQNRRKNVICMVEFMQEQGEPLPR